METHSRIKKKIIFFVAGKSGGHIIPALTRAHQLQAEGTIDHAVLFSTDTTLDQKLIAHHAPGLEHIVLPIHQVPYRKKLLYPLFFARLLWSFCISFYYLLKKNPVRVISMGGLVSLPVCYAARIMRIPFELYELNAVPGRATAHLAPWATQISLCFEQTKYALPAEKCRQVNYPIRAALKNSLFNAPVIKKEHPTLFITGGSQGSVALNTLIQTWLENNPEFYSKLYIIHQAGSGNSTGLQDFYKRLNIKARVFDYHPQLEDIYPHADLIVTRAGAGALFEALFFKKQSIVIPLETHTTAHQKDNAYALSEKHPDLFTVITHTEIADNPFILYAALNKKLNNYSI